jgi:hypothetical protein
MTQLQIDTIMTTLENEIINTDQYTEKHENLESAYDAIQQLKGE